MRVVEAAFSDGMRYSLQPDEDCSLQVFISGWTVSFEEDLPQFFLRGLPVGVSENEAVSQYLFTLF